MSIEIGQYIEYLLIHRGNVSLPGLGSISLIQKSAYLSHGKTKINPPSLLFNYVEGENDNNELLDLISKAEGIAIDTVQANVNDYSQAILNNYLNYDFAPISNVGVLQKEGTEASFIPNGSFAINAYNGLQPISIDPIRIIKKDIDEKVLNPSLSKDYDWITYLGALLLGALMIIAYHHFVDPLNDGDKPNKELTTISDVKNGEPETDLVPREKLEPGDTEIINKPINVDLIIVNHQDSVAKQDNLRNNEELTVIPRPQRTRKKLPLDSSGFNIAKPKKDQKCIILVGVYNRPIEALVMVDRIKAKGYLPFRDVKYDANRVGIQFNCEDKDPKEMLLEIKKVFNDDAYYLQPNITI
jgi:hypothetical protein